jgi:A/G-specific adenine glycosylase
MPSVERESEPTVTANGHVLACSAFQHDLRSWGVSHFRAFPWRTTTDPFHILIAEMMLRRTQARQVVAVYRAFVECFPDAHTLASAPERDVAEALYSLGLAWRVPAFQQLARVLVEQFAGLVPSNYQTLVALPGVGDYVASAICCFAFSQPMIISDINTVRVVGRLFGIPTHAESRRRKPIRDLLSALLDRTHPIIYNYALLDLAALVCLTDVPDCASCPVRPHCRTGQEQKYGRMVKPD